MELPWIFFIKGFIWTRRHSLLPILLVADVNCVEITPGAQFARHQMEFVQVVGRELAVHVQI